MPTSRNPAVERPSHAALRLNRAAWNYTKCAILFFFALLITWLPSSINRVYSLINPEKVNWQLNYAACFVLPLMGFCNFVTYVVASRSAVKTLLSRSVTANLMPRRGATAQRRRKYNGRPWDRISRPRSLEENLTAGVGAK